MTCLVGSPISSSHIGALSELSSALAPASILECVLAVFGAISNPISLITCLSLVKPRTQPQLAGLLVL
jgi:hypothetical protein